MDSVMDGFYDQSMNLYGRQYEPKKNRIANLHISLSIGCRSVERSLRRQEGRYRSQYASISFLNNM
jgi:hypothetical protein